MGAVHTLPENYKQVFSVDLQKDKKKAVRNYIQAHFLIPEHPRKAEVLYKATVLLKELKDKRWQKFADLLKKQYPNSGYAGKL